MNVDGAPTIFCFHASCVAAVAEANRRLRRELAGGQWAIALMDGRVLRSGDVLRAGGEIVVAAERQKCGGLPSRRYDDGERIILETLLVNAERFRAELFDFFRWPMERILEDSPRKGSINEVGISSQIKLLGVARSNRPRPLE